MNRLLRTSYLASSILLAAPAFTLRAEEPPPPPPVQVVTVVSPQPKAVLGKDVNAWRDYLKNHDIPEERRIAVFCIGEFGPQAAPAVQELRDALANVRDDAERILAAEALGQIEADARPALADLLALVKDEKNPEKLRASCIASAARIAPDAPECAKAILNCTRDRASSVRQAALDALVTLALHGNGNGSKEILPTLRRAMASKEDCEVAASALRCMGPLGTDALVEAVNKGKETEVRQAALAALARMGEDAKGAREAMLLFLKKDRDPELRGVTLEALAAGSPADDAELLKACANALGMPNASEQAEAIMVNGGSAAANACKWALKPAKTNEPKLAAIRVLGKLGDAAATALSELASMLDDPSPDVQLAAAQALADIGPTAGLAKAKLENLVSEGQNPNASAAAKDPNRRRVFELAAVNVSRPKGSKPFTNAWEARPTAQLLRDIKESRYGANRATAAMVLGSRKDAGDALAPALLTALNDPEPVVQQAALKSLGACGPAAKPAIPVIAEWLAKGNESQKKAALGALAGLGSDAVAEKGQPENVVPALTALALSPLADKEDFQEALFPAIKAVGAPVLPAFAAAMKEPEAAVEIRGCRALGYMGSAAGPVIKDLSDVTLDPDEEVAKAALLALRDIGPAAKSAVPRLTRLLGLDNPVRKVHVLKALNRIGLDPKHPDFKDHMQALMVCLLSTEENVNFEAHLVMMNLEDIAIPPLMDLVHAMPEEPPMAALRVLAALKAEPKEILPMLARLTWPGMQLYERIIAADLLGIYAPKETQCIPALAQLMADRNEDVVRVAGRSLRLYGAACVPEIQKLLKGRNPLARKNALNVLEDMKNAK